MSEEETRGQLLVFGYAAKVYRDEERAGWIHGGRHLIPWMGDTNHPIDRYDVRATLSDLSKYESPPGGFDPRKDLTPAEREEEEHCDYERYLDLQEEEDPQEDESMGLEEGGSEGHPSYSAVQFSYGEPSPLLQPGPQPLPNTTLEENRDQRYQAPRGLTLPPGITLPEWMKTHAVIEKTARFIASHGTPMEILLKTKQAGNPQFGFLAFHDPLNPYYKHLLYAIQTNQYQPPPEPTSEEEEEDEDEIDQESHQGENPLDVGGSWNVDRRHSYLHPSLNVGNNPDLHIQDFTKLMEKMSYKPRKHSSYSSLVNRIQEASSSQTPSPNHSLLEQVPLPNPVSSSRWNGGMEVPIPPKPNPCPPPNEQAVIEKMAQYVLRNGEAFEELAGTKGDVRFTFLHPSHPFHWYYLNCKERFKAASQGLVVTAPFMGYQEPTPPSNLHPLRPSLNPPQFPPPPDPNALSRMSTLPPDLIAKIQRLKNKKLASLELEGKEDEYVFAIGKSRGSEESVSTLTQSCGSLEGERSKRVLQSKYSAVLTQFKRLKEQSRPPPHEEGEERGNGVEVENGVMERVSGEGESGKEDPVEVTVSEEMRRKEERRRKAALFLQRLKETQGTNLQPTNSLSDSGGGGDDGPGPTPVSVNPHPPPPLQTPQPMKLIQPEIFNVVDSNARGPTLLPSPELHDGDLKRRKSRKHSSTPKRSKAKKRRHNSGGSSSSSHHRTSSTSSRTTKKSKRKHSKKRKKRREKSRDRTT